MFAFRKSLSSHEIDAHIELAEIALGPALMRR
jgi:hypothetical protein